MYCKFFDELLGCRVIRQNTLEDLTQLRRDGRLSFSECKVLLQCRRLALFTCNSVVIFKSCIQSNFPVDVKEVVKIYCVLEEGRTASEVDELPEMASVELDDDEWSDVVVELAVAAIDTSDDPSDAGVVEAVLFVVCEAVKKRRRSLSYLFLQRRVWFTSVSAFLSCEVGSRFRLKFTIVSESVSFCGKFQMFSCFFYRW